MKAAPKLILEKFQDLQSYKKYEIANTFLPYIKSSEDILVKDSNSSDGFQIEGYCFVCQKPSLFNVDYSYSRKVNGVEIPNWRERLVCSGCKLNNRMRAAIHFFELECFPSQPSKIYLTEQSTLLYKYLSQKFPRLIGSEFLGEHISGGDIAESGLRNEDLTNLSFQDGQFDCILSFDVFEHIPNYIKAFNECYRILKPAGKMLFTVPFRRDSQKHIIRALREPDGTITHLEEPEYHGDPISKEGCLCYQHFGWKMLDELRKVGFSKVEAVVYWSRFYGYLGNLQIAFICKKSASDMENKIDIEYSKNCQKNFKNAAMVVESEASYFSIANKLMREGKLEEAIAYYRRAIAQNPNFAWYHHNLAEALIKQGQFDEAIASYRRAIEINPNFASFHHNLGEVLVKQGQLNEAIASYRRAIELNPTSSWFHYNLAEVLVKENHLDEAIHSYNKAIELNPDFSKLSGDVKPDIVLETKAIEVTPNSAEDYYNLGASLSQKGEISKAIDCHLNAIEVQPGFKKVYRILINYHLQFKSSQLDKAINLYKCAIEENPNLMIAYVALADAYKIKKKIDKAIGCLQKVTHKKTLADYPAFVKKHWNQAGERKPNFMIIGAEKSGTSSLYLYLIKHPQILTAAQKEIHYFTQNFDLDINWYLAHFPPIPTGFNFLTGEASTSYLYGYNNAEKRVFDLFPDVKILAILRNPIDRAISHYHQNVRLGRDVRSFEEATTSEIEILSKFPNPLQAGQTYWKSQKGYLANGLYIYFLEKWMTLFPREQLLLLKSEDFYAAPGFIMKQVFDFLGLPEHQLPEYPKYNAGSYAALDDSIRRELVYFFHPHNQKLEEYLGRKFNWE